MIDARPLAHKRAISNLIENAIKHAKQGKIKLREEQDKIVISIDYKGPGIPELEMDSVFEPFYRLVNKHKQAIDGFGLGCHWQNRSLIPHRAYQ